MSIAIRNLGNFEPISSVLGKCDRRIRDLLEGAEPAYDMWAGRSGQSYVHRVYGLIACPELPEANYVMVRRRPDGSAEALRIGRTNSSAPSVNLAHVRRRAAQLGATEIHVHMHASSAAERQSIETDLRAGIFAELAAEPTSPPLAAALC